MYKMSWKCIQRTNRQKAEIFQGGSGVKKKQYWGEGVNCVNASHAILVLQLRKWQMFGKTVWRNWYHKNFKTAERKMLFYIIVYPLLIFKGWFWSIKISLILWGVVIQDIMKQNMINHRIYFWEINLICYRWSSTNLVFQEIRLFTLNIDFLSISDSPKICLYLRHYAPIASASRK